MPRRKKTPSLAGGVGSIIRYWRKQRGMTQWQLGQKLGVTAQQISKYERSGDNLSLDRLIEIAAALEVDPAVFFRDERSGFGDIPQVEFRAGFDGGEITRVFRSIRAAVDAAEARLRSGRR